MAIYLDGMDGGKHNSDNTEVCSKTKKVCKYCGSEEVVKDAWAAWDNVLQVWVLDDFFDYEFCKVCDGETTIIDKEE